MTEPKSAARWRHKWRVFGWAAAAALLMVPAAAMQFTREVNWTGIDFAVMGAMLLLAGLALEGLMRTASSWPSRFGAGIAVLAGFLLIWVNLAVGFFGDEDNPANLMLLGVLALAIAGSLLARGRAAPMAVAMATTAAAQIAVSAAAYFMKMVSPGETGMFETLVSAVTFGGLWLVSAGLFHLAARSPTAST